MQAYHLQRSEREITDDDEKKAIIRKGLYTTIAMNDGMNPYIVTMNYGYDEERHCLYFHAANRGHKLDILRKNPVVMAMIIEDLGYRTGECDHFYRSVEISGTMGIVNTREEKIHGMEVMLHHLEKDADEVRRKLLADPRRYDTFTILKLSIDWIVGKQNIKG